MNTMSHCHESFDASVKQKSWSQSQIMHGHGSQITDRTVCVTRNSEYHTLSAGNILDILNLCEQD